MYRGNKSRESKNHPRCTPRKNGFPPLRREAARLLAVNGHVLLLGKLHANASYFWNKADQNKRSFEQMLRHLLNIGSQPLGLCYLRMVNTDIGNSINQELRRRKRAKARALRAGSWPNACSMNLRPRRLVLNLTWLE